MGGEEAATGGEASKEVDKWKHIHILAITSNKMSFITLLGFFHVFPLLVYFLYFCYVKTRAKDSLFGLLFGKIHNFWYQPLFHHMFKIVHWLIHFLHFLVTFGRTHVSNASILRSNFLCPPDIYIAHSRISRTRPLCFDSEFCGLLQLGRSMISSCHLVSPWSRASFALQKSRSSAAWSQ